MSETNPLLQTLINLSLVKVARHSAAHINEHLAGQVYDSPHGLAQVHWQSGGKDLDAKVPKPGVDPTQLLEGWERYKSIDDMDIHLLMIGKVKQEYTVYYGPWALLGALVVWYKPAILQYLRETCFNQVPPPAGHNRMWWRPGMGVLVQPRAHQSTAMAYSKLWGSGEESARPVMTVRHIDVGAQFIAGNHTLCELGYRALFGGIEFSTVDLLAIRDWTGRKNT